MVSVIIFRIFKVDKLRLGLSRVTQLASNGTESQRHSCIISKSIFFLLSQMKWHREQKKEIGGLGREVKSRRSEALVKITI